MVAKGSTLFQHFRFHSIVVRLFIHFHLPSCLSSFQSAKLSKYKSQLNVENFVQACRQLGISDPHLCKVDDIVEELRPVKVSGLLRQLLNTQSKPVLRDGRVEVVKVEKDEEGARNRFSSATTTKITKATTKSTAASEEDPKFTTIDHHHHSKSELSFQDRLVSYLCLFIFLGSIFVLYVYPVAASYA